MASDLGAIRHALSLARDRGFAEVVVEDGDLKFRASLDPAPQKRKASGTVTVLDEHAGVSGPVLSDVVSPMVGYFRSAEPPVEVGDDVAVGQVVGVVTSLGEIPYAVESTFAGTVEAMLVEPGQPVMYGQTILQVKP